MIQKVFKWRGYPLSYCGCCKSVIIACKCTATSCNASSCEKCSKDINDFHRLERDRKLLFWFLNLIYSIDGYIVYKSFFRRFHKSYKISEEKLLNDIFNGDTK